METTLAARIAAITDTGEWLAEPVARRVRHAVDRGRIDTLLDDASERGQLTEVLHALIATGDPRAGGALADVDDPDVAGELLDGLGAEQADALVDRLADHTRPPLDDDGPPPAAVALVGRITATWLERTLGTDPEADAHAAARAGAPPTGMAACWRLSALADDATLQVVLDHVRAHGSWSHASSFGIHAAERLDLTDGVPTDGAPAEALLRNPTLPAALRQPMLQAAVLDVLDEEAADQHVEGAPDYELAPPLLDPLTCMTVAALCTSFSRGAPAWTCPLTDGERDQVARSLIRFSLPDSDRVRLLEAVLQPAGAAVDADRARAMTPRQLRVALDAGHLTAAGAAAAAARSDVDLDLVAGLADVCHFRDVRAAVAVLAAHGTAMCADDQDAATARGAWLAFVPSERSVWTAAAGDGTLLIALVNAETAAAPRRLPIMVDVVDPALVLELTPAALATMAERDRGLRDNGLRAAARDALQHAVAGPVRDTVLALVDDWTGSTRELLDTADQLAAADGTAP